MGKGRYILVLIFAITIATRLMLAFQTPYFAGEDSYFSLRQVEHISHTGLPLYHDELSYGGRNTVFMPLFYYILAFFDLFLPIALVGKVMPCIFASSIVILVYLISKNISGNEDASLFSAFISGFIPILFKETVNTVSVYTLVFPMILLLIYLFLDIDRKDNVYYFLITLFLLILTSPAVILIVLGFVFYMFLMRLEELKQRRIELEVILFSIVLTVWIMFIVFKNAFLLNGIELVWQNIPKEILKRYFTDITVLGAIYQIGSLPLSYGMYSIYDYLFRKKDRKLYLIIGFAFSSIVLLWLKLIEVSIGLMALGIIATLLFPKFYAFTFDYIKTTRFARFKALYFIVLILAFIFASVIPSIMSGMDAVNGSLSDQEYQALSWIKKNTDEGAVIMSPVKEGILISSIADRKNVADSNFLMQRDAEKRFKDIETMYNSKFETEALGILDNYGAGYIYFSDYAKDRYGIDGPVYTEDRKCFDLKYDKGVKIFKVMCELK